MESSKAVWFSIFHSISAFCTAGLGFIVVTDLWYRASGKTKKISFTTKIITYGFIILLGTGTALFYFSEPLITNSNDSHLLKSFFQAMTSMTTVGFNTVPIGSLTLPILLFTTFLMYIGASPSGTAGGMKITTLTAMISVLKSRLLGQKESLF